MKTLIAAIGALALATTVADAAPANVGAGHHQGASAAYSYQVAGGARWQGRDSTTNRTPNQGAGTSRSNDANQG